MNQEYIGIIEVGESCFTVVKEGSYLIAATACNVGLIEHYREEIDFCFDIDTNVSSFIEIIQAEELKNEQI